LEKPKQKPTSDKRNPIQPSRNKIRDTTAKQA